MLRTPRTHSQAVPRERGTEGPGGTARGFRLPRQRAELASRSSFPGCVCPSPGHRAQLAPATAETPQHTAGLHPAAVAPRAVGCLGAQPPSSGSSGGAGPPQGRRAVTPLSLPLPQHLPTWPSLLPKKLFEVADVVEVRMACLPRFCPSPACYRKV